MEVDKREATVFKNKLDSIQNQFLIAIDRYRSALQQQYLEGKDTSGDSENAQNLINDIYSKAFILTSQVNSNIIVNNNKIQSLDEELTKLKNEVDKEEDTLKRVKGSEKGALPRKKEIKSLMNFNYIETGLYMFSIISSGYLIYKYMVKK
jgi:hypothetical protein